MGSGDAGVGWVDVVGGAEDGDFGEQVAVVVEQGARPCRCGGGIPAAGGGANVFGEFADELSALLQAGRPRRIGRQDVGDGG